MKQLRITIVLMFALSPLAAGSSWFSLYTDSAALARDAAAIISGFSTTVRKIRPDLELRVTARVNTTPYLLFYSQGMINLPLWRRVMPQQKAFFYEAAGSDTAGRRVFGLFFNGFCLAREMAHALADAAGITHADAYTKEYDANILGILYWRENGREQELEACYHYAKKMLAVLQDPVPAEADRRAYLTAHYDSLAADPRQYLYIQFTQFAEIYEYPTLPGFDHFFLSRYGESHR